MRSARTALYLALFVVLALLAACAAPVAAPATGDAAAPAAEAAAPAASDASLLVVGIAEDTASLDPARAYETLPTIIHKATYETLVTFPAGSVDSIEPLLADSWTISDDGLVYTFSLNPSAVFSNGDPVKASDVVFSFNRMVNIKGNPSFLADGIVGMEAPDDATFVLTLANPDPAILAKLVFGAFSVTSQAMVEAQGGTAAADAAETDTAEQWFNNNSAGSGAYVIEKWDPQVETVLVRNENYYGTAPAIERIIIRNLPESATQKLQLEAGDLDIAFDLGADQVAGLAGNENVTVYEGLSDISAEMSNPLVQKAVRLALDYEGIRALAGGQSVTPASVLPVGFMGAFEANSGPQRDIEGAKALLAEAGFGEGELAIEITYPDFTFGGFNFGTFAQKIQADLQEAGFNATLKPTELQVALEAYRQGTEPFGLWLWLPDYRDSNDYLEFLPEGVVGTRTGWVDATGSDEIKAIRDAAKVETDTPARIELFTQMQNYLIESGPYAAVVQPGLQVGLSKAVQGFVYNPQWRVDLGLLSK
jgi:peptide/nickel transport system substrate-binding protein